MCQIADVDVEIIQGYHKDDSYLPGDKTHQLLRIRESKTLLIWKF